MVLDLSVGEAMDCARDCASVGACRGAVASERYDRGSPPSELRLGLAP
jgi:hypothetical protein